MPENVYEKLQELLDCHPFGCPPATEINEILKILFTEDEARVALGLGFRPFTVEQIAQKAGVDPKRVKQRLESLANKGLVFAREKKGVWGYALLNAINIFENPYRRGIQDETMNELTSLWKKYRPKFDQSLSKQATSILRVIPLEKKIESNAEVLPYEKVDEMIEQANMVGITRCACREFAQNCDAPREACMVFDSTCAFLVERGFARSLTKEEIKQKLKEFDEMGLVRQVNNTRDRLEVLCHCCSCCCGFLRALNESSNPRVLTHSAFLPVRDKGKCLGCGICADQRCPVNAIEIIAEEAVVSIQRCIGCGLCASGCPNDAIRMERRTEIPEPPANVSELGMRMLQDREKLEAFMETMTPPA